MKWPSHHVNAIRNQKVILVWNSRRCEFSPVNSHFDSWSGKSLVSTCDVFNCLFPLDVQNDIQLLSRVFCYSWLVCLLGFWLRNAHRRTGNFRPGGGGGRAVNHLPKKFLQVAQIFTKQSKRNEGHTMQQHRTGIWKCQFFRVNTC